MTTKKIHVDVIRRYSEAQAGDTHVRPRTQPIASTLTNDPEDDATPQRMRGFFQVAEHRKRYFLEKLLLDA